MLLWVNVHGGFVMGFVLLGLYLASNAILLLPLPAGRDARDDRPAVAQIGAVTALSVARAW